ncbi:MAG: molybdopterin synthase catalytic subunit MoaE [Thiobacillaceae bacterium]|nr:molybdopterin synthase catalytic subunit MoaE [Thiobacillaceae bacterium]MCX7672849.1 molybdopterin synthase catalytic subunit MoaE [Thiobacillaceae bacterium]MDW8324815.1 molybdopterin synthase catalytic subunit MoaE [Burkholderiales bacterium]
MKIRVQTEPFDLGAEIAALYARNPKVGAVASFLGITRDENEGYAIRGMRLEHYPGMTERALTRIAAEAMQRWPLLDLTVVHRVGELKPTEPIVLVAVAAAHRGEAFAACEFIMDYLKTRAPFWKKELTEAGGRWVEARASDDAAAARWDASEWGER